ncbi:MAG: hypothetical protein COT74_13870 [Bdellovibrionales bacterium CG10_big_fil_rev_8_21_14_0_10_45_34]|nr:MAG: hypothetical protein COT74_13870 [Bdellovibrionales bacterium CG10_big_fil_rev_8_21_14_0_10_45_34]
MNLATLKALAKIKGLRQSDIAVRAGLSRQAVSKWWNQKSHCVDVLAKTHERLAKSLGVSMETLSNPLPVVDEKKLKKKMEVQLLWDKLYPDIEGFSRGLVVGRPEAFARLVQVFGLFASEKIVGKQIIHQFPKYKKIIHPARRRTLEIVWNEIQNQA